MSRKKPVRLYPKEEVLVTHEQIQIILFLLGLLLVSILMLALAISCKSYYYTSLV